MNPTAKETGIIVKKILTKRLALILRKNMNTNGKNNKAYTNWLNVKPNTIFSLYSNWCGISYILF